MSELFVEKYRPKTIKECILPANLEKTFKEFVKSGDLPNMLLVGSQGTGKTTVAKALCNELGFDYKLINGSENGNIDTLRTQIRDYVSTVSLNGGLKVVILDEADGLNAQSTQPALRSFIEEFSNVARFIFTANFKQKIIEPLQSRCSVYDFTIPTKERAKLAAKFYKRLVDILKAENIEVESDKILPFLIQKHFPDYRRILNEIQRHSTGGKIESNCLSEDVYSDKSLEELMGFLKNKEFSKVRQWVEDVKGVDSAQIYTSLYNKLCDVTTNRGLANAVLIIADYQYKHGFVANPTINLTACLVELMGNVEFK